MITAKAPTDRQLLDWLRYWQECLRMQDWRISVSVRRKKDAPIDAAGWCSHQQCYREAQIGLLDPVDYERHHANDIEFLLVHELLHIHFAPFEYVDRNSAEGLAQEQAINMIAGALISLRRAAK